MSQVDWSKAPEGAEYFCEMQWFKTVDGEWRVWCPSVSSWAKPAYAAPDNFSWWGNAIQRPSAWSGEGLPPVGTVCEWKGLKGGYWVECEVIAVSNSQIVLKHAESSTYRPGRFELFHLNPLQIEFRPIRTAEQIAAEERESAISAMADIGGMADTPESMAAKLYDAGYRKVTP